MNNKPGENIQAKPILENIEYSKFFKEQGAMNIRFSSILRMNATFPYILPSVSLPSIPEIKIMDAGIRDNYGFTTSLLYIHTFRNWIAENTSGIVILQLRDQSKSYHSKSSSNSSLLKNITSPLGNFYNNWTNIQNFEQDQMIQYASSWFKGNIDIVYFQLKNDPKDRISMSWHLTNSEKSRIKKSLYLHENNESLEILKELLK